MNTNLIFEEFLYIFKICNGIMIILKESFNRVTEKYLWMNFLQKNSELSWCIHGKKLAI